MHPDCNRRSGLWDHQISMHMKCLWRLLRDVQQHEQTFDSSLECHTGNYMFFFYASDNSPGLKRSTYLHQSSLTVVNVLLLLISQ